MNTFFYFCGHLLKTWFIFFGRGKKTCFWANKQDAVLISKNKKQIVFVPDNSHLENKCLEFTQDWKTWATFYKKKDLEVSCSMRNKASWKLWFLILISDFDFWFLRIFLKTALDAASLTQHSTWCSIYMQHRSLRKC